MWNGETFFSIKTKKKYGIDPNFFFQKDFVDLYLRHTTGVIKCLRKIGAFFNNRAAQIKNFEYRWHLLTVCTHMSRFGDAMNYWLEPNGIIIFHDSNPQSEEAAPVQLPSKPISGMVMSGRQLNILEDYQITLNVTLLMPTKV